MAYSQDLRKEKSAFIETSLVATATTDEIDLEGGTLCGLLTEGDLTSANFTITVARKSGGTYVSLKNPLSGGAAITYTVGTTATGYYPIDVSNTYGFRFCKIVFGSTETATVYIARRNLQ